MSRNKKIHLLARRGELELLPESKQVFDRDLQDLGQPQSNQGIGDIIACLDGINGLAFHANLIRQSRDSDAALLTDCSELVSALHLKKFLHDKVMLSY